MDKPRTHIPLGQVLSDPYSREPLRCVEHHRMLRLVGYCPMCWIRLIDTELARTNYGLRPSESTLEAIRDLLQRFRAIQRHSNVFMTSSGWIVRRTAHHEEDAPPSDRPEE